MTDVAFFLSTHRCGTTFLSKFFQKHFKDVHAVHQPEGSRLINVHSTMALQNKKHEKRLREITREQRIDVIENLDTDYYIETNGFNNVIAKFMLEKYPDMKLIHVIRDPRTWVPSYMSWVENKWKSYIAYRIIPYWNINGAAVGDVSKKEWKSFSKFEKFCWYWSYKNRYCMEQYADLPNYRKYLFEDITLPNKEVIQELLEFMNLQYNPEMDSFFDRKVNQGSKKTNYQWQEWSPEKIRSMDRICGPLMRELGYGNEPEWQAALS